MDLERGQWSCLVLGNELPLFCQANALTTVIASSAYLREARIGSGQCSDRPLYYIHVQSDPDLTGCSGERVLSGKSGSDCTRTEDFYGNTKQEGKKNLIIQATPQNFYIIQSDPYLVTSSGEWVLGTKSGWALNRGALNRGPTVLYTLISHAPLILSKVFLVMKLPHHASAPVGNIRGDFVQSDPDLLGCLGKKVLPGKSRGPVSRGPTVPTDLDYCIRWYTLTCEGVNESAPANLALSHLHNNL
eukprot:sb/3468917/